MGIHQVGDVPVSKIHLSANGCPQVPSDRCFSLMKSATTSHMLSYGVKVLVWGFVEPLTGAVASVARPGSSRMTPFLPARLPLDYF
jgi:hypothetical protein